MDDDPEGHGLQGHQAPATACASPGERQADASPLPAARWEHGLVPTSTVEYENRGATIRDPHVETISGDRVNVLAPGEEYVYAYAVDFERTLGRVRCGMLIRSVTGVELDGAATSTADNAIGLVERGRKLEVSFRFRCLLAPGEYFVNAGVLAVL